MQQLDTLTGEALTNLTDSFKDSLTSVGRVIDVMEIHNDYGIDLLEVEESN